MKSPAIKDTYYNLRLATAGCKHASAGIDRASQLLRRGLITGLFSSVVQVGMAYADGHCPITGYWVLVPEELAGCHCQKPATGNAIAGSPQAGCPANREYCIASFTSGEQWVLKRRPQGAEAVVVHDGLRHDDVLEIRRTVQGPDAAEEDEVLHLSAPVLSRVRFDAIRSVRLWVRGDGTDRYLRVFIKDRNGEVFTHTRRLYLDFDEWMQADLPFSPVERLLNHGGDKNGVMDPPLIISHILVSGKAGENGHLVSLDRLSVVGCLAAGSRKSGNSNEEDASRVVDSRHDPVAQGLLLSISGESAGYPVLPRRDYPLVIDVINTSSSRILGQIQTQVHRVFGDTLSQTVPLEVPASGQSAANVPIDLSVPGWYRIQSCVVVEVSKVSCAQADYLVWYPVGNSEPDSPVTFPGVYESVDLVFSHLQQDLSLMSEAGVKVLRFPFRWKNIEPRRGAYLWSTYDRIFEECKLAGIIPQPTVIQTPEWARKTVTQEFSGRSPAFRPPHDMEDFRRFMEAAARRYAAYSPYWEIWNEPHAPNYWVGGNREEYIRLLRAGYSGVKAGDGGAKVLVGAMRAIPGQRREFMRYVLKHGRPYFDILTVHSHGPVQRLRAEFKATMALWREIIGGNVPVWLNEAGISVDPDRTDSDLIKASEIVKKMVVARALGIRNFSWFNFRHTQESTSLPYDNYAAVGGDGRLRPVILAYNNVNRWLRGALPEPADGQADSQIEIYKFRKKGRVLSVVWVRDPENKMTLDEILSRLPGSVRIFDMFGGQILRLTDGADLALPQGGYPVFVVEDP